MKNISLANIFRKEKKKILSLDIGKRTLKIAFLSLSKDRIEVLKYDIRQLKPEDLKNEQKVLVEFIRSFISINSITEKDIVISLQDPDALIIRRINLPGVTEKEIEEALKWEIKEEIPFDLNQAQIDWQLIGEYTDREGAKRKDIISVCVKKDLVDKYVQMAKSAGLNLIDIKNPPFVFSYILEKLGTSRKDIVSVLDIGASTSVFSIYKDGKLAFLRSLPFSSDQLTASIKGTLVSEAGKVELTKDNAEEIKKEFGIPSAPNEILKDGIKGSQVISLIRPVLEKLISEIERSVSYYTANFESNTPKAIYITGGGSNLKGLQEYLKDELKIEVEKLLMPNTMNMGEGIDKTDADRDTAQLITPVGAALGIGKRPSLLPQEYKVEKVEAVERISLRLIAVSIGLIFLFSFFIVRTQVSDYRNRVKNAKIHLETIGKISDLNNKIIQREVLIGKIRGVKLQPEWVLKELSNLIPSSTLLNNLELDQERKVLILNGYVVSRKERAQDELTAFMKALEASPFFGEATLRSSKKTTYDDKDASEFEIWCSLAE